MILNNCLRKLKIAKKMWMLKTLIGQQIRLLHNKSWTMMKYTIYLKCWKNTKQRIKVDTSHYKRQFFSLKVISGAVTFLVGSYLMKFPIFLLGVSDGCSFSNESVQTCSTKKNWFYEQDLIRLMLVESEFPVSVLFLLICLLYSRF